MKIRLPVIFLIGTFALVVSSFYFLKNFNNFHNATFRAYAASDVVVYRDQISPAFSDWSWGSNRNFNATEQVKEGSSAIGFTPQAWGGLYLHTDSQIDTTLYESLTLSIRGSADNQKFAIVLYDNSNQMIGSPHPLSDFGNTIENNRWKTYTIPLKDINPSQTPLKGVGIQEITGQNQPTVYIDNVSFILTSQQPLSTPSTSVTPTPFLDNLRSPYSVYEDSINNNWENWSWNSEVHTDNTSPVLGGNRSINLHITSAWGALYLHARNPFDTTPYSFLSFTTYATIPDQNYAVILLDKNNNILTDPIPLSAIGGNPTQGAWKTYTIPLSLLNATAKNISGMIFQDQLGSIQPSVFIDDIYFGNTSSSSSSQALSQPQPTSPSTDSNSLTSIPLYTDPSSAAKKTADLWRVNGRNADADQMEKIANNPAAIWLTDSNSTEKVRDYVSRAKAANAMPVLITYNIPGRDCGQYSSGGTTYDQYKNWIQNIADTIGDSKALVVLEPDALGLDCLQNDSTYSLLRFAVQTLKAHSPISVYVTASTWVSPDKTASRLQAVGIDKADGFAINVSGFDITSSMIQYGTTVSQKVNNKHFIIDTSRNGNGAYDQSQTEPWCNPPGRALGNRPTTNTGNTLVDAYLWLKIPGESDGSCRGGPSAGQWWPEYALGLAQKASF